MLMLYNDIVNSQCAMYIAHKKENTGDRPMKKLKNILPFALPPLLVLAVMLAVFHSAGLYPFGEGSVAWCDMYQQTIPLLTDFKDVLDGKTSIFLNFNNAGGMNFYGVFFFFLASPFSLLVKFVDKGDIVTFVNILVILKLMTASVTSAVFFRTCRKELDPMYVVILSVMYAFCGYGMLFYQNIIWLDMMYLLPLLVLALNKLITKQNNIPYIAVITAMLVVNYYISYMMVVFILVFMAVYTFRYGKEKGISAICAKFLSGSLIGALLSAVIWLPCFTQFLSSGRKKSIIQTISNADFITSYKTVLPLIFCSAFVFVIVAANVFTARKRSKRTGTWLLLFFLLLVPFVIEPVNLMWHTGNYMSFPARYGFITIFAGLICCGEYLSADDETVKQPEKNDQLFGIIGGVLALGSFYLYAKKYITDNFEDLSHYTSSLWGNDKSFEALAELFVITALCYGVIYLLYRKSLLRKELFALLTCAVCIIESGGNTGIYMASEYVRNPLTTSDKQDVMAISDKINDDSFYRVMTDRKIMDYNTVGALGYSSLSHYTSLTDRDYMFTQKRLGYTTVWMEVGSAGGTEFTNALYDVKYKIVRQEAAENSVYSENGYSIVKMPYSLGLGVITDRDVSGCEEIPSNYTRSQVQEYIFKNLFGDESKLITDYPFDTSNSDGIRFENNQFVLDKGASVTYTFDVKGRQSLYADCFNRLSNDLSEEYFDSLNISVNGINISSGYPKTTENGVLKLGEFKDQQVTVRINCSKSISCYSFGVFGLDLDVLESALSSAQTADLSADGGMLYGSCVSDGAKTCVVALPYQDNFTVRINGEKTEYQKVFSDFVAFELKDGQNDIEITFVPKGFFAGLAMTVVGGALLALYIVFRKKIKPSEKVLSCCQSLVTFIAVAAAGVVYLLPVILRLTSLW